MLHNNRPLWQMYEAMKHLTPERAKRETDRMKELAKIAAGEVKQPEPGHFLFSPKGLNNEFGYSGNYGSGNPPALARVAKCTVYDFVTERTRDAFRARSHFLYLHNDADGFRRLERPEWVSSRNFVGFPGREEYLINRFAAENRRSRR